MPQQILYQEKAGPAQVSAPARTDTAPVQSIGQDFWRQFDQGVQSLVRTGAGLWSGWQESINRDVEAELDTGMREWEIEYRRTHRGIDAVNAEQDYRDEFAARLEAAWRKREAAGGTQSEAFRWRPEAGAAFAATALRYTERGAAWQDEQKLAYDRSVLDSMTQAYADLVTRLDPSDPSTAQVLAQKLQVLGAQWGAVNQGLDPEGFLRDMGRKTWREQLALLMSDAEATEDTTRVEAFLRSRGAGVQGDVLGDAPAALGDARAPGRTPPPGVAATGSRGVPVSGGFGWLSARHESAGRLDAVGRLATDGVAIGPWQVASKPGGVRSMLAWCDRQGRPEFAAFAAALRGRSGDDLAAAYQRQARENPAVVEEIMRGYNVGHCFNGITMPAIRQRSPELAAMIGSNDAVREAVFSTMVQHGAYWGKGAGAPAIAVKVFRKTGADVNAFIAELYRERGTRFPSSEPDIRESIRRRFAKESRQALDYAASLARGDAPVADAPAQAPAAAGASVTVGARAPAPAAPAPGAPAAAAPGAPAAAAPGASAGERMGVPDPVTGVSAQDLLAAQRGVNALKRGIEARRRAAIAEQERMANEIFRKTHGQIVYAMETGDWRSVDAAQAQLDSMGSPHGQELREQLAVWRRFDSMVNRGRLEDIPLADRMPEMERIMMEARSEGNIMDWKRAKETLDAMLAARVKEYADDPAAFVAKSAAGKAYLDGAGTMHDRALRSIQLQERMGRGLGVAPRMFSKGEAQAWKDSVNAMPETARSAEVARLRREFGTDFSAAAQELGIPAPAAMFAANVDGIGDQAFAILHNAATMKLENIPANPDLTAADALADVQGTEIHGALREALSLVPQSGALTRRLSDVEKTMQKAAIMGLDLKALDDAYVTHAGPHGVIIAPASSGASGREIYNAAAGMKSAVYREIAARLEKTPVDPGRPNATRVRLANILGRIEKGVWFTEDDGNVVFLADADTGARLLDDDGRPVAYTVRQLLAGRDRAARGAALSAQEEIMGD